MASIAKYIFAKVTFAISLLAGSDATAQQASEELAKAAQNPVATMISVPFQNNTNYNVGPFKRAQDILNIQPVVPITLSFDWNLISCTIIPLIDQPTRSIQATPGIGSFDCSFPYFFLGANGSSAEYRNQMCKQRVTRSHRSRLLDYFGMGVAFTYARGMT